MKRQKMPVDHKKLLWIVLRVYVELHIMQNRVESSPSPKNIQLQNNLIKILVENQNRQIMFYASMKL